MCTSFSSFHVLNRVNIVHLIYIPQSSVLKFHPSPSLSSKFHPSPSLTIPHPSVLSSWFDTTQNVLLFLVSERTHVVTTVTTNFVVTTVTTNFVVVTVVLVVTAYFL